MSPPRRRSRRRDTESPSRTTVKGLLVIAVIGGFTYFAASTYNGVPFVSYRSLTLEVPGVGNLIKHDPVRIGGVRVGQVIGETVTPTGMPLVQLQIDPGTGIPVGTQVMIRANGLLGARYVQLIPGASRKLLPNGATLIGGPATLSFGVPEALGTFDSSTRTALGELINGLGTGLLGHGEQLNNALHGLAPATPQFAQLAQSILARPGAAARLIPSVDSMMLPLDLSHNQLAAMLAPATRALNPFVTQRLQLRAALVAAPPALASTDTGLGTGETLLASAAAFARAAQRTLPAVPAGLRATAALMRSTPVYLGYAKSLLQEVRPAVPAALTITGRLMPSLQPLRQALANLAPMLVYTGQRGCDIQNFGVTMRSMTGYGGTGSGPIGAPMEFRARVLPAADALAPIAALNPPKRDAYAAPCRYLDRPASANPPLGSPGSRP
jgi:ABC-type transporter Mla subunit MlaD